MTPAAAASLGPATSGPSAPGPAYGSVIALGKPNDSLLTVVIVAVVVLLLLIPLLRHLIRRRGGWRRFRRGVGRELTLTRRAFGEPLRTYRRHRRGVRALARQLSDPRGALLVRRLLDGAAAALADAPGAVPHAVRTEPGRAAVQIAARPLPEPPAPWEPSDEPGPQRWELPLTEADTLPQGRPRAGAHLRPLPVAIGMADDACVHLDLAAGPGLITVEGDAAARGRLLQALAAQLDRPGSGASVSVTDGVHPQYPGQRLDALLRSLEEAAEAHEETEGAGEFDESGRADTPVVVCAAPGPEQARRLSALAASGAVVCLIDGRVAGHSWALRVDGRGRVVAPELGLDADSAPLGGAVAAAVRADRRRLRRESAPRRAHPPGSGPAPGKADRTNSRNPPTRGIPPRGIPPPRGNPGTRGGGGPPGGAAEVPLRTTAPARTTTGSDLLAEPATARDHSTAASSGTRED